MIEVGLEGEEQVGRRRSRRVTKRGEQKTCAKEGILGFTERTRFGEGDSGCGRGATAI